ncbi:putative glycerol kinase 5 [Topomyia yanbarensis]|uniref:putative glycerol kinase 5 n=1 Tax=Topomyia yanbarensis TaxID=2498891 RepID=UPI00273CAA4F|nr:putative glycerol kinase 5 [Topomyia yanbarensis]
METAIKYVAALNVDQRLVKCFIYALFRDTSRIEVVGSAIEQIEFLHPATGREEIDPVKLWNSVQNTIKAAIAEANLTAAQIAFIAISSHRGSFTCWNRSSGTAYHNFITAQDLRADHMVKDCNGRLLFRAFKASACLLYCVTKSQRYLSQSVFNVTSAHVTMRLAWLLENCPGLQQDLKQGDVVYGTIDAWLLFHLRKGVDADKEIEHISDITNCAASGFYDPFTQEWTEWATMLYPIKRSILPTVVTNSFDFGYVHPSLFGSSIKIGTSISDTSAALWGNCCFDRTDLYIRMDTTAVVNIITRSTCLASVRGMSTGIGYKHSNGNQHEIVYVLEETSTECTTVIDWGIKIGLFADYREASTLACSVSDSNGVFFVSEFNVLGRCDITAGSSFVGIKKATRKEHLVRALLESMVYRIALLYVSAHKEILNQSLEPFSTIKVDGSVAQNDFICQMLADITSLPVERGDVADASALGAVLLAGLNVNVWTSKNELIQVRKVDKIFLPSPNSKLKLLRSMRCWEELVEKFKG